MQTGAHQMQIIHHDLAVMGINIERLLKKTETA